MSEPAQEMWFSQTNHPYSTYWLCWVVIFIKHTLSVMTSRENGGHRPDMTIAVDWDVKHQIKP